MYKKGEDDLVVGLDIGTSKVVAIVGRILEDNTLEILGIGSNPSRGLKKGVVINIDATVQAIRLAVEEAGVMSDCQINSVITGIAGNHVKSLNSNGIVGIKDGEVKVFDVEKVIEAAKAVAIPADQKIIHVLPQEFKIDDQGGIKEPLGMSGVRLEANVHMVTGSVSAAQNIVNCVRRCNLEVEDMILEQLASSYAVLSEDEKELGVCLVDIGGGTTDIAVFVDGSIKHTAVISVAGDHVTNDIAIALRTPTKVAESVKLKYGWAISSLVTGEEDTDFEITCIGEENPCKVSKFDLAKVIQPRYEELFLMISDELVNMGLQNSLGAGVVLTGGSSKIKGAAKLGELIFGVPVRVGAPSSGFKGLGDVISNPIYSTGIGLLLYGLQSQNQLNYKYADQKLLNGFWGKIKNWMQGNL